MATYNNEITLPKILDGVLAYTEAIILVNDGSTDLAEELLVNYQTITILHLPKNKGKGNALKKGFKKALVVIGPEGGFSPEEESFLGDEQKTTIINLPTPILRAPHALSAAVGFLLGCLNE